MAQFPTASGAPPQGSSTASKWWVVFYSAVQSHPVSNIQGLSAFQVIQAPNSKVAAAQVGRQGFMVTSVNGPFDTKPAAQRDANGVVSRNKAAAKSAGAQGGKSFPNPFSWLGQQFGGMLASAIEAGVIQIIKDIWNTIAGPLYVIAGVILGIVVLAIYFRNDIAGLAGAFARGAAL